MRVLVTAIGSMAAEAVVSSIERFAPDSVSGCNMHPRQWTPASRLVRRFHEVPPASAQVDYVTRIMEICVRDAITHVVPLTDPEVDVMTEHRHRFKEAGVILCISPGAAVETARDKLALHRALSDHPNVRTIPTIAFDSSTTAPHDFPMLAKPRRGRSSEGHVRLPDESSLAYWERQLARKDYVLQPLLRGDIVTVDVVRPPDGRSAVAMARHELLRTSNGAGLTVRMLPGHRSCGMALDIAAALDLQGCVNMEFLVLDEDVHLMDVNPRFSAGVGFSLKAGYDMVLNHLRCFVGEPIEACEPPPDAIFARGYTDHLIED